VCIPNFNYGAYLGDTIRSVLAQTYPAFEIIIADNASTDNSVEVVRAFDDSRIKLVRNSYNIGFSPNLDRATESASGDFILLLSSDDRMKPDALETYSRIVQRHAERAASMVLVAEADRIDAAGRPIGRLRRLDGGFLFFVDPRGPAELEPSRGDYEIFEARAVGQIVLGSLTTFGPFLSMLYPRALYERVQGYNNVHSVDPDSSFAHKLLFQLPSICYVNQPLFEYREHTSNQASIETRSMSIKHPIDKYLYTVEYNDAQLAPLGHSQRSLERAFVDTWALKVPLTKLARGRVAEAARLVMFGIAAHPRVLFRRPGFYLLVALLITGPLAPVLTRMMLAVRRAVAKPRYGMPAGARPVPVASASLSTLQ
jgi:glycosyltransferase involved in cell wall biosynthesis